MSQPLALLGGLTVEQFLADYWQKRPLLIRQAIPGFTSPVSPEELAGLACEEGVESRIVMEKGGKKPWQVEHGPFSEKRFARLPKSHWTLLVQGINRHVPEFALLQDRFDFLPQWRLDDVMVSYAPPQGTVGPHADNYDVFLLQGLGERRWMIDTRTPTPEDLIPGLDLRIMKEWRTEQEWVLEPGDMLYLPPGVAHYGVALTDCVTVSVGYRAPTHLQIMEGYVQEVISGVDGEVFYADPDLSPQSNQGEIAADARAKVRAVVRSLMRDDAAIDRWFGRFITETRGECAPAPEEELSPEAFTRRLRERGEVWRSEYCRWSWFRDESGVTRLFVDGSEYELIPELDLAAPLLCEARRFPLSRLLPLMDRPGLPDLLAELHNSGCLYFPDEE